MHHDQNYKRLFAHKLMAEHLLRACLPPDLRAAADFSALEKLSAAYVSPELRERRGDTVWRLRLGGRWAYLLIMLEFQSRTDRWMALRVHTYTGLLYEELRDNKAPGFTEPPLPPVLPIVLYNGAKRWTAAQDMRALMGDTGDWLKPYQPAQGYYLLDLQRVVADHLPERNLLRGVAGLEQSRSLEDLSRVCEALRLWLQGAGAAELQRVFADWIQQIVGQLKPEGTVLPPLRTLEEVGMTLAERVAEWPKHWLAEGRERGLAEGRSEGLAEGREEGLVAGREEAREQGLDQQRALLCRLAAARFGDDTSARLAAAVEPITDSGRLAEVGEWLVRCDTAAGFLARVEAGHSDGADPSGSRR